MRRPDRGKENEDGSTDYDCSGSYIRAGGAERIRKICGEEKAAATVKKASADGNP